MIVIAKRTKKKKGSEIKLSENRWWHHLVRDIRENAMNKIKQDTKRNSRKKS